MSNVRDELQTSLGGSYTLERELGRGGMATVYLAQDTKHHRPVALKVLHPEVAATVGPVRFRREIETAARLQHPHILSVFDSGETAGGLLWFTMPYVEGETLRDRLVRERQLPIADAVRIARDAAQALQYAHTHGVIHRDIKPENLLLTRDGNTLVADFGVARALEPETDPHAQTLTGTGMAIGTPAYMSPEQASGERTVDARTDIYALGAVLYEVLAGEPPFTGASAQAVIAKRFATTAPSVLVLREGVPPGIAAAIATALARNAADRYATAAMFGAALDMGERSGSTGGSQFSIPGPRGTRVPVGVALLGLGFFVGVGVLFAWRHRAAGLPVATAAGPVGLAVLPFDVGNDTANAYFADGITNEIRGKLSALPALRLIASASSNQYRHSTKPQQQVGHELGVHYLLTGRVQWEQSANGTRRVRVSPELVEIRDGAAPETKWQQSYDTTLADVFDVQAAVATRVADKLGVVLTSPAQTQLATRPTQNLAAYDAYLRSTALVGIDPATIRRALGDAEHALALDSNFAEAWAQVALLRTSLYVLTRPTKADADSARQAANRAVALAPAAPWGYLARGIYAVRVSNDFVAARAAFETALRLDPSSSVAYQALTGADASEGKWAAALSDMRQAAALDPRSSRAATDLQQVLLWLRLYPEARAEAERGLTLAPGDLGLAELRAMSRLGVGDLVGARAGLREIPPTVDRASLVAYLADYWDLYWVLDSADRALALTLSPAAYDNDRGNWAIVRAMLYGFAGDTASSRRFADSARLTYEGQVKALPNDFQVHELHGLALALVGQRADGIREGERGLALALATGDQFGKMAYARHLLARIYATAGEHGKAIDQLDSLLAKPYFISPAWLKIDPTWDPLRGDPRFERLLTTPLKPPPS